MTTTSPRPAVQDRLFTLPFVLVTLGELAYFVADGMAVLLVPLHATGPLGSGSAGAGLAFGAFAASALVLRPLAGRLCDVRGRRPLLVGGAVLAGTALLLTARVDSMAELVGLRLLAGVAEAAVFVAAFAAVADLAPTGRMGEAISYNSLALYVGLAGGPLLAEYVVENGPGEGFAAAWVGAALLAALSAVVFATVGETKPPAEVGRQPTDHAAWVHRSSLPLAAGFFTAIVAMGTFLAFGGLLADEVGFSDVSLPLAVYGTVVVLGRILFARVPDRVPPLRLASAAAMAVAVGLMVVATWGTPTGMITGTVLVALGVTFTTPAYFAAVFSIAPGSERGAASATMSAAIDLGLGVGPVLLGLVAAAWGIPVAMAAAAGLAALGGWWTVGPTPRLVPGLRAIS